MFDSLWYPPISRPVTPTYLASERAAVDYCNEVVDGAGRLLELDSIVSVSGLVEVEDSRVWDDQLLDQQYRRFLNGS